MEEHRPGCRHGASITGAVLLFRIERCRHLADIEQVDVVNGRVAEIVDNPIELAA